MSDGCPNQINDEHNCDELIVLLNDSLGCTHLEAVFNYNCTGCACLLPSTTTTSTAALSTDIANSAEALQAQQDVTIAIWTLVSTAIVVLVIVTATLVHKATSKAIVLPDDEKRPPSDEKLAQQRREELHGLAKGRRNGAAKRKNPTKEIIEVSNQVINARLKSAFRKYARAREATNTMKKMASFSDGHVEKKAPTSHAKSPDIETGLRSVNSPSDLKGIEAHRAKIVETKKPIPELLKPSGSGATISNAASISGNGTKIGPQSKASSSVRASHTKFRTLRSESKTPPGRVESKTPPGRSVSKTPPGQAESKTPPVQSASKRPPGRAESKTPPNYNRITRTSEYKSPPKEDITTGAKKNSRKKSKKKKQKSSDSRSSSTTPTPKPQLNPLNVHATLKEQVEVHNPTGSPHDSNADAANQLNRINTEHHLTKPPVRQLDSQFFQGSP